VEGFSSRKDMQNKFKNYEKIAIKDAEKGLEN